MVDKIKKTDDEWRRQLTDVEYQVTRCQGTEPAFSGSLYENKEAGQYHCVCCGQLLFQSSAKYDSRSGWPSFYQAESEDSVEMRDDNSHMMRRTEVVCSACDAHLGHVFDDGPNPTGKRFCINSVALKFDTDK